MPRRGVSIDKRAIARHAKEIEREYRKHPITIPVRTGSPEQGFRPAESGYTINNNGPVFYGDANGAQLAWGNDSVAQISSRVETITPGYEEIARAVATALERLPEFGLPEQDEEDAQEAADEVLAEVVQPEPDKGKIRKGLARFKGYLAQLLINPASEGIQAHVKETIESLDPSSFTDLF